MMHRAAAFLLLAATAAASTDVAVEKLKAKMLAPDRVNRMLVLSDECIAANEALAEDPAFLAPLEEIYAGCPESLTQEGLTISIDFSVCGASVESDLTALCNSFNGT